MVVGDSALDLSGLPTCGVQCVTSLLSSSACDAFNETCLCGELDLNTANPFLLCVGEHCTVKDGLRVKNFTVTTCEHPEPPHLTGISTAFLVLFGIQTIFFILRMLTRIIRLSKWGWDDASIIVAFLATIGVITGRQLQIQAGMGKDIWTLTPDEITNYIRIFYVFAFIYTITLALVKASICFLYLRLFTNLKFRRIVWATQAFNFALMTTFIFAYAFQCTPPHYFWEMWHGEKQGKCLSFSVLSWTHSGLGIVLDIWMLALPFWQVLKLDLPLRKRLDAFVMFGCGIFLTIVSILRLQCLVILTNGHNPTSKHATPSLHHLQVIGGWNLDVTSPDAAGPRGTNTPLTLTEDLTWLATWSNVEITVGIIIACLPAARLLLLRYLPSKIAAWNNASRTTRSSLTARSSKVGSTATWVSGLSGKRESDPQPGSVPLSDASHFDKDRACSTQVSVTSPRASNAVNHLGAGPSVASGLGGRRESELPLVPGFESSQPAAAAAAAGSSSGLVDETPPAPTPVAKDRRIWVEQHIYVSNEPATGVSTEIPREDDADSETEPWIFRKPGAEVA